MVKRLKDVETSIIDCKTEVEEFNNELTQLEVDKFDRVAGHFSKLSDAVDSSNDMASRQINLIKESGMAVSDSLYRSQITQVQKQMDILGREKSALENQLSDALASGYIEEGSDEWLEMVKAISETDAGILDCKVSIEEFNNEVKQLEVDKFERIAGHFTDMCSALDDSNGLIGKQIGLLEESGELVGTSYYEQQKGQTAKQAALLEQERALLTKQLSSSVSSGIIKEGSDEWLEMVQSITEVDKSILECQTSMEEFDNAILNLHTEIFDRIQKQFSDMDSELSNLVGLFDDFDVSDDKGNWTDKGLAQLGLLAQQYELAEYQVQQYNEEIDRLTGLYLEGRYSATEYTDRLAELTSAQWDAVNASESAKDSIIGLNKTRINEQVNGINKEIEAFRELTDAQIDALKAAKDLHDYEKSIAEKANTVTGLERQIAAMQNDTSAAGIAKRKKLEDELAKAKAGLEEAQYQHSVEQQENALNEMYDAYKAEKDAEIEKLEASMDEREQLLSQSFTSIKENTQTIADEITGIAQAHGISVSETLINAWKSGCDAIAGYGQTLTDSSSVFISQLSGVEQGIYGLQAQADESSKALAGMFATQADNLVGELGRTYDEENRLINESYALQGTLAEMFATQADGLISELSDAYEAENRLISESYYLQGVLADMFSTRADNLVSQLTASYYSGQNLGYMTQALRDSLINTLERGYNISSISGALESIRSSVNGVASAANNAAQALASMGAAQQAYNSAVVNGTGVTVVSTSNKNAIREANSSDKQIKTLSGYNNKPTMLRYAKGGIVTKDSRNPLNRIAEAVGEDTLIAAKEGESVLTPKQTDAIQSLADTAVGGNTHAQTTGSINKWYTPTPEQLKALKELAAKMDGSAGDGGAATVTSKTPSHWIGTPLQGLVPELWGLQGAPGSSAKIPEATSNNANRNVNNVQFGNLINVQGNVDSTNIRQMESIANKAVDKLVKELNDFTRFGRI